MIIDISRLNLEVAGLNLLKDFSLQIKSGERVGITGASGVGKSTLLKSVVAGSPPSTSTFRRFNVACQGIGYLPQGAPLLPWYSVERNLNLAGPVSGFFNTQKMVEVFDLERIVKHFPYQLSGGERQRVSLCCAVLGASDMVVLDEPLTEVGFPQKWAILEFISSFFAGAEERDIGLLLCSHDVDLLCYLCDRVLVLRRSFDGSAQNFFINEPHPRPLEGEGSCVRDVSREIKKVLLSERS